MNLPDNLALNYVEILSRFNQMKDSWSNYPDGIIPEDKEYAKEIINFVIDVLDHMLNDYDDLSMEEYRQFLAGFHYPFYYGPNGDDKNYLDFEEKLGEDTVTWLCYDLKSSFDVSKETLEGIKQKYMGVLKQFQ